MNRSGRTSGRRLDWSEARRRLALALVDEGRSARASQDILEARAVRHALVDEPAEASKQRLELLVFERKGRRFGVDSYAVLQVARLGHLSRVPGAKPSLLGLTNLQGELVPVFELVVDGAVSAFPTHLVVLATDNGDFALAADSVDTVLSVAAASLALRVGVQGVPYAEHVRGVSADGLLVLDGRSLVEDCRVFVASASSADALEP